MSQILSGQCLCGAVTFSASELISKVHACHCDDCQRFVGTAFIAVNVAGAEIKGPVNWFKSSDWGERGSCSTCGSAMFWRLQEKPGNPAIALGAFNDRSAFGPIDEHYFADNIPPSYDYSSNGKRLNRAETLAKFSGSETQ